MRLLVFLMGLFASPWVDAIIYRDPELESIVIDDSAEESLVFMEVTTTPKPNAPKPNCVTFSGFHGICERFEECFPYVADYESEDFEKFQLYNITRNAVSPCEGKDLICCPDYNYGIPDKKPQFAGQTTTHPPPASPPSTTVFQNYTCGASLYNNDNDDNRVVGGRNAVVGEFPHVISMQNNGYHKCGGSLISDQWVLTAAHCIVDMQGFSSLNILIGDHDIRNPKDVPHQTRRVRRGYYHKDFSMRHLQNDVALLELDSPVTFSKSVQPICLSSTPPDENGEAVLCGWGKTGQRQPPSAVLKTVKMKLIPHEKCRKMYASEPVAPRVTTSMMCAGETHPSLKDACNGDSGGPLSFYEGGKANQIGVVSWGLGCGIKPGVYSRVDKYLAWIQKNSLRSKI